MTIPAASTPALQPSPPPKRWTYYVLGIAFLFVLMPFLFWRATWFGQPLTDVEVSRALSDSNHPRTTQHALSQVEAEIRAGDPAARQWYPAIVRLAASPVEQIRLTSAWVMGQDNHDADFHHALLQMLSDSDSMVARNAALSLVRFGDDSGHAQIVAMLRPYALVAPAAGRLRTRLKIGDVVNAGTLAAHIQTPSGARDVRVVVPGTLSSWTVADKSAVAANQPIAWIDPAEDMVWEALRALFLVGAPADLPDVERYTRPVEGMPAQIQKQAQLTAEAIRRRTHSP
jgi:hypothetical protein